MVAVNDPALPDPADSRPARRPAAAGRLARLDATQWSWLAPAVIAAHLLVATLAVPPAVADPSAEPRPAADHARAAEVFVVAAVNPMGPVADHQPVLAPPVAPALAKVGARPEPVVGEPSRTRPPASVVARTAAAPGGPVADAAPAVSSPTPEAPVDAPPVQGVPTAPGWTRAEPVVEQALAHLAMAPPGPGSSAGSPGAPELPVYPTRIPPPVALQYDLRRGLYSGTGELAWRPVGERYTARLEGRVAGLLILEWSSEGGFDAAGLAPTRYVDRRLNGNRQAANFQRDTGQVSYSGPAVVHALPAGAQDRLSWMLQIAAIAEARPGAVARDATVSMWVSGARGDADVWVFRSQGAQALELPGGLSNTIKLLRLPRHAYDTRVEVWLDPARGHLPVRARLSSGRDDDVLDLTLRR